MLCSQTQWIFMALYKSNNNLASANIAINLISYIIIVCRKLFIEYSLRISYSKDKILYIFPTNKYKQQKDKRIPLYQFLSFENVVVAVVFFSICVKVEKQT